LRTEWLVVVLCLLAALSFALSSSLKHVSAGQAPDAQSLHLARLAPFVRATVSNRLWLAGIGCDVLGLSLQLIALHLGGLTVVQPLLISGLLFALILRHRRGHRRITGRQVIWAALLTAALAGFLLLAETGGQAAVRATADRLPAVLSGVVGVLLAAACIELGRRQQGAARAAALLGVAVGVVYAGSAALLKSLADIGARAPLHVLVSWQLYAVVAVGASGLLMNQLAFQAGPITASLPATSAVDPLLSIVIGVLVYDEHIRRGIGGGVALIALLLLMGTAVVQLARSTEVRLPAVATHVT
jgi:hypothetical protein